MENDTQSPPRYAFVVGAPRSGTTMLRAILDRHPDVSVLPELRFFDRRYGQLLRPSGRRRAAEGVLLLARRVADLGRFGEVDTEGLERDLERARSYRDMFVAATKHMGTKEHPRLVVEKSPVNALLVPPIRRCIPGALFVYLLRDGRECIASACRKWHGDSREAYLGDAALWAISYRSYLRWVQPRPHHALVYEHVTESPDEALAPLFAYLGLSYETGCHERIGSTSSFGDRRGRRGIHRSRHFREYFGETERREIESVLRPLLVKAGYRDIEFPDAVPPRNVLRAYRKQYARLAWQYGLRRAGLGWLV